MSQTQTNLIAPESRQDLVGPLFSALLGSIYRHAETHTLTHGPLNPTLRIILDEASRLAATDNLPALLSVSAGWGIRIATVWQNLGQITARYGPHTDEILGNSLTKLILGPIHDAGTRDYLTALLDTQTEDHVTYSVDQLGGRSAQTSSGRDASKVTPQTLHQLTLGEALLISQRELPALGRTVRAVEGRRGGHSGNLQSMLAIEQVSEMASRCDPGGAA